MRETKLPGGHHTYVSICLNYMVLENWRDLTPRSVDDRSSRDDQTEIEVDQELCETDHHGVRLPRGLDSKVTAAGNHEDQKEQSIGFFYTKGLGNFLYVDEYLGCQSLLDEHPFLTYTTLYLGNHVNAGGEESHLDALLRTMKRIGRSKVAMLFFVKLTGSLGDIFTYHNAEPSSLSIAVLLALPLVCRAILDNVDDYLEAWEDLLNSLPCAVINESLELARLLLQANERRPHPRPLGEVYCKYPGCVINPLREAVERSDVDMVELLLQYGYPVNEEVYGRTALDRSIDIADEQLKQILVQYGGKRSNSRWNR